MKNWEKTFLPPFTLGGHVFLSINECCEEFVIPHQLVERMLASADYPGCRYLNTDETASYFQTLSVNSR